MLWFIAAIFLSIILSETASYFIYRSKSLRGLRDLYDSILGKKRGMDDTRTFNLRYAEHPFLAFTSNPDFRNSFGEKIHNKYGFRADGDFSDIDLKNDIIIYCTGGSSTYCNFIEKNEDTWPGVLETDLNKVSKSKKVRVINGSCSGWTSFQSLIRFSAWADILKPNLVIIYHGKNDFSPFVNSKLSVPEIYPDYGNVMHSLKFDTIAKGLPALARYTYTGKILYGTYVNHRYANVLWHIYDRSRPATSEEVKRGLKRIGPREWEFIISRYRTFKAICKDKGILLLFVLQRVKSEIYRPYMDEINRRIKSLESRHDNCFVYDFAGEVQNTDGLLYDSVHFTQDGARVFAERVSDYIIKNITLSGIDRAGLESETENEAVKS